MHTAVTVNRLTVRLADGFTALDDVSVSLPAGKVVGCIGPSGAGKTTLMRVLVGRQRIAEGSAVVLGLAAGAPALRSRVSYMTQGLSVYGDLTVAENVRYFAAIAGVPRSARSSAARAVLEQVDLTAQASQLVGTLSGGQKQRVSLAVALLGSPELLVLDEPTVGLDPLLREQLWQLFYRLAGQGKTIVLTSHAMDEASRCHDLLLLRGGRALAHGSPAALCKQTGTATVEQSFVRLVETAP